jgi:tetratricopeptide (TPR) repeat protein
VLGFVALGLVGAVIVALATAAGWATGQRAAAGFADATRNAVIVDQINRLPGDIANRNSLLVNARLQFLASLTPGVPEVAPFSQTATALHNSLLATATPDPTQTPALAATLAPTGEATITIAETDGAFDLPALLQEAQTLADTGQWADAIALLDAIAGIDPAFETARVRNLLTLALNSYARELYNSYQPGGGGRLAEAIVISDRADQLGVLEGGLAVERQAAQLYLDARRSIGLDPFAAIRVLERLYGLGPGRYYEEARQLIHDQYVLLGDAETGRNEHCPAANFYQSAVNYLANSNTVAKRNNANTLCAQATPIGTPALPNLTPIAPIGVPGT